MNKYLRRYTDLPAVFYLLRQRKLTLLDPASWNDKNDSYFLELYRERKGLKSVLALCFTQATETYHHWKIFADGSSGVCVRFQRESLMKAINQNQKIIARDVRYLKIDELRKRTLRIDDLPFCKRHPYEDEREFRLIYEFDAARKPFDISMPLSCVDRITLSPLIASVLADEVKKTIRNIPGCNEVEVVRSTLISNEQWKSAGEDAR